MHTLYIVSVWLHIVAAALWVGGMLFFALVVVPALRHPDHREAAGALIHRVGVRYRAVGWASLALLVATGALNLAARGVGWADLASPTWWGSPFGRLLAAKLVLVAVVLVLAILHDVVLGPRATALLRAQPASPAAARLRRQASLLGRLSLLVSLAILALAVMLVRGAPW